MSSSNASFKPDFTGYKQVLSSSKVQAILKSKNEAVAQRARSSGYYTSEDFPTFTWKTKGGSPGYGTRARSYNASMAQSRNKVLTRAFNSQSWD